MSFFDTRKILITGACGTVGREILRQLLSGDHDPAEVIGVDNNETELFLLENEFTNETRTRFIVGDVRDRDAMISISRDINIIFHTAALKHVILCERAPMEVVNTNIQGVNNIITAAIMNGVDKVIFTSSDKAVNPTNVMGTSKLMGERLITAANSNQKKGNTIFASTRFGNVLGSNGSVIPIFRSQIESGKPVTLTDERMTRFIMSVKQAVTLVLDSAEKAKGGEVFITKMPAISIKSLAEVMIEKLAPVRNKGSRSYPLVKIGAKPGEKLYEELMSSEETGRAMELRDYFVVLPAFRGIYKNIVYTYEDVKSETVTDPYISANQELMGKPELVGFLENWGLL